MAFFTAAWGLFPLPASAQCIPGMPCIVDLTDNDPYVWGDGPNVGPNKDKNNSSDSCDADFMNVIYGKAYLEATRQNILNQVIVRKPDSVLKYSCYDQVVSMTADIAGPLFSESKYWHNKDIPINNRLGDDEIDNVNIDVYMGSDKLDKSLEKLVLESLVEYGEGSFEHDFLGGAAAGVTYEFEDTIRTDYYDCKHMDEVYFLAKCNDFATDDLFFTFETLVDLDPRLLPEPCDKLGQIKEDHIKLSKNEDFKYAFFDKAEKTWLEKMKEGSCTAPIPTGVMTTREEFTVDTQGNVTAQKKEYEEKVCTNPGCYYDQPSGSCKN